MAQRAFAEGGDDLPLCSRFVEALPVTGAAISVFGGSLPETSVCASDGLAARLDELQYDLGEGPRWEAARTHAAVLVPRAQDNAHSRWPVFGKALLDTGAEALFVFPLAVGALEVGVVELYRTTAGPLDRADLSAAAVLADTTAWNLLDQLLAMNEAVGGGGNAGDQGSASPLSRREIHQATGMVLAQTGSTATDALLLLRAHAFSSERTLRDVAGDIIARKLDFTPA